MAVESSYTFDSTDPADARRRRRRIAEQLLARGMDTSPIASPWQGAARMAQALMGGVELGMEDKKERDTLAAQNAYGAKLDSELSGGMSPVTKALASVPEGRGATAPADLAPLFDEASKATGIPAPILMAKVRQESNFNPNAVGGAGEVGLAQILPSTARDPGFGMQGVDPAALKDPRTNIMFGAQYLAARGKAAGVNDWNDPQQVAKALAAYNGGGDPNYVQNVMRFAPKGMFAAGSGQATLAGGDNLTGGRTMTDANRLMQIATDPMAPPQIRERAKLMLSQMPKPRDPLQEEATRLQNEKARRDLQRPDLSGVEIMRDPTTGEIVRVDKATGQASVVRQGQASNKAPETRVVKQPDGSEVALQWNPETKAFEPLNAPQGGNPVRAPVKLTEQQSKDVGFVTRAEKLLPRLEEQDKALTDTLSSGAGKLPMIGNYLKRDEFRKAEQTGRELLAVILRKDTGAAVTDQEMELYGSMYLPRPGDDPATLQQKREGRKAAIDGLRRGLGGLDIILEQRDRLNSAAAAPKAEPQAAQPAQKVRRYNPQTGKFEEVSQ